MATLPQNVWNYLLSLYRHDPRGVALGLLQMWLAAAAEGIGLLLLIPLLELLQVGSDEGSGIQPYLLAVFHGLGLPLTLETVLAVFLTLVAIRSILSYCRDVQLSCLQLGFIDALRKQLYRALVQADWIFLAQRRSSDVLHVLTVDINRIGMGTHAFLQLLVAGIMVLVQVLLALALAPGITVVTLLLGAALMLVFLPLLRRAHQLGHRLTTTRAQVFANASELLAGIKLAKSYAQEAQHQQRFATAVDGLRGQMLGFTRQSSLLQAGYQMGAALALSGVLYTAVHGVNSATLLVVVLIFARLLPRLSGLQQQLQLLLHSLPAFEVMQQLQADCEAAAEPSVHTTLPKLVQGITLEQLSFRYPAGERYTLQNLQLRIPARATTALVGPSGAGKSTLADILVGLMPASQGSMLIDQQPLHPALSRAWRQQVAYVPQEVFLFHDTVRANLLWASPGASEARLWQVLRLSALDEVIAALPAGLDTSLGDRGIRLSGGERQRLALARALLREPELLVLDEATSALDSHHERRIQQALDSLQGQLTLVIIAHRLSTVRHADQVVVLEAGRIVEVGRWETLATTPQGRLRAMLEA